jgi:hypothetical protein
VISPNFYVKTDRGVRIHRMLEDDTTACGAFGWDLWPGLLANGLTNAPVTCSACQRWMSRLRLSQPHVGQGATRGCIGGGS